MCRQLIHEIRHSDKSIEAMPKCAKRILEYFNIPEDRQTPIIFIMREMGIVAFRGALEPRGLSAYIAVNPDYKEKYGSTRIACVNSRDNLGHQRFALAHELAHFLFDYDEVNNSTYYNTYFIDDSNDLAMQEPPINKSDSTNIDIEYRANQFAAALLMPSDIFKRKYDEYIEEVGSEKTPDALSQFFEVSVTAVKRRISEVITKEA